MLGETLSHYKVLEKLGQGGMGEVYLAEDTRLGHRVAIKVLLPHIANDRGARARFLREAKAVAQLDHPSVLPLNEFDEHGGVPYFVTPYMPGGSLRDELKKSPGTDLELGRVLAWIIQVAEGLAAAHRSGVVHRDIKPDNLLLSETGDVRIADFGLATIADVTRITQTGTSMGTLRYMSPEQVQGKSAGPKSDLFSLGTTLFELLTGQSPFDAEGQAATLHAIAYEPHPRLQDLRREVSEKLVALVDELLNKDPDRRPNSADDVAARLRSVAVSFGIEVQPTQKLVTSPGSGRRPPRALAWAAPTAALLIAFIVWWTLRGEPTSSTPDRADRLVQDSGEIYFQIRPFDVQGGSSVQSLRQGIVELMSARLDDTGALRRHDDSSADDDHAHVAVEGKIVEAADNLYVSAQLQIDDGPPVAAATVEGPIAEMHAMLDQLAIELLLGYAEKVARLPHDIASIQTSSLPALREFLRGEWHIAMGHFASGAERMDRAREEDPEFAMAWFRAAAARMVTGVAYDKPREALSRARKLSSQMTENTRMHLGMIEAFANGDARRADQLARALISIDPNDVEAWFWLEANQYYNGWKYGQRLSDALPAIDQLEELGRPSWHRGWIRGWSEGIESPEERLSRVVDRAQEKGDELRLTWATIHATFTQSEVALDSVLTEWNKLGTEPFLRTFMGFDFARTAPLAAQQVANLLTRDPRTDEVKAFGHVLEANIKLQRGRWNDARLSYSRARQHDETIGFEYEALGAITPFIPVPEAHLFRLHAEILAWDASRSSPGDDPTPWLRIHDGHHAHLRLYLLGMIEARLGQHDEALARADELQRLPGPPKVTDLAGDLARGIRARSYWEQGQASEALVHLEALEFASDPAGFWYSPFYLASQERYLKAEILRELGRVDEAQGWYPYPFAWGMENIYLAPYHLSAAQHAELDGDPEEALVHYGRFAEYWADCEEELFPVLNTAESAAQRLNDDASTEMKKDRG